MERQCEMIQYKIQQQLILQSDEIDRLNKYLIHLKSEIISSRDKLQILNNQISQAKQFDNGYKQKIKSSQEAIMSQLILAHHKKIQELRMDQEKQIEEIQNDFCQTLEQISQNQDKFTSEEFVSLQQSIHDTKARISSLSLMTVAAANKTEEPIDTTTLDIQRDRIQALQDMLMAKNFERDESLKQSKKQLTVCVETLEEIEHNYEMNILHLHKELETLDIKHKIEVDKLKENHSHRMSILTRKSDEAKRKSQAVQKSYDRIISKNRNAMTANLRQMELVKMTTVPPVDQIVDQEEEMKFKEVQQSYKNAKIGFQNKIDTLTKLREDNHNLKRELDGLRFQKRFGVVAVQ